MTIHGWDSSHFDWSRGPMDIGAAVRDGIQFMTHKVGEARTVTDDRFDDFYRRAKGVVPLLGGYYVNHPGDQDYQADRFLWLLDDKAPGWRDGPFILQVDAEKFDYMDRAPNKAECKAFCDRLVSKTGGRFRPLLYAPKWLYGNTLDGVGYPLWASAYGTNPAVGYRSAYPGDSSSRWVAYSGQTPVILQYGSRTKIGSQSTCDANAYRGTLAQLRALVYRPPVVQPVPVVKPKPSTLSIVLRESAMLTAYVRFSDNPDAAEPKQSAADIYSLYDNGAIRGTKPAEWVHRAETTPVWWEHTSMVATYLSYDLALRDVDLDADD